MRFVGCWGLLAQAFFETVRGQGLVERHETGRKENEKRHTYTEENRERSTEEEKKTLIEGNSSNQSEQRRNKQRKKNVNAVYIEFENFKSNRQKKTETKQQIYFFCSIYF